MGISAATVRADDARAQDLPPPPDAVRRIALFLDLDGVLAPLAPEPDDVGPEPARTAMLQALAERLEGRLAIVSGRSLTEIDRIAEGAVRSAAGVHGLERRDAEGRATHMEASEHLPGVVAAFEDFAQDRPGALVEDKGLGASLHYRNAPDAAEAAHKLAQGIADRTGLTFQPGSMVVELKTPGASKGTALTAFMQEPPFRGAIPVMVGDDLTDENGFEAATALGGFGVLVGKPRVTAARFGLADPDAVTAWLHRLEATT